MPALEEVACHVHKECYTTMLEARNDSGVRTWKRFLKSKKFMQAGLARPMYEPLLYSPLSTLRQSRADELSLFMDQAHYMYQNKRNQMTFEQYTYVTQLLFHHAPANVLIWGLGQDSNLWSTINRHGRTAFLENHEVWLNKMKENLPDAESHLYNYKLQFSNNVSNSERHMKKLLAEDKQAQHDDLYQKLPADLEDVKWDVILVDSPAYAKETRMESIWNSKRLKDNLLQHPGHIVHILVHDCERTIERMFSDEFLGRDPQSYTVVEGHRISDHESQMRHYMFRSVDNTYQDELKALRAKLQKSNL
eukprot:CAMPEP_0114280206 /NCGR_PEP_ID=MMETSP0059-20121206/2313_1 /TAXON_ID=36894 /ORGANISM="Pyramimonas parkeae, Strain CCMP726" /LENGTH=305 /DNA_ID=CAMNT_0001400589 /DNA_START=82 /DNA_END=999 /DNA_ORIENTATION=+